MGCYYWYQAVPVITLLLLSGIVLFAEIKCVKGFGYYDYAGDPFGGGDPSTYDHPEPEGRVEPTTNIQNQPAGQADENEISSKTKKFKLFEKRRLSHEKSKGFCKKREGRIAQAMNENEAQRIQALLMKGTSLSPNVWVGTDETEWETGTNVSKHGPEDNETTQTTDMCPAMNITTKTLTPADCSKEFAFICEFPPGKGKPPEKIEKFKIKDEMRRKRDLEGRIERDLEI